MGSEGRKWKDEGSSDHWEMDRDESQHRNHDREQENKIQTFLCGHGSGTGRHAEGEAFLTIQASL